jgi:hypothetical protein
MSLSLLNYKYIGRFTIGSSNAQNLLSAIGTAFASTTYQDGSSRSMGTGSAWAPSSDMFNNAGSFVPAAVFLTPPSSSLGHKIIYAGGGNSGTPTMIGADANVNTNTRIIAGLAKNAGSYNGWANASPFTTGSFSGYVGSYNAATTVAIHAYESQDTVALIAELNTNQLQLNIGGAILDPESSNPLAAESDGKLYGMINSGYGSIMTIANSAGGYANNTPMWYAGTAGYAKSFVFTPNASSIVTLSRQNVGYSVTNINSFKNLAGEVVKQQIYMEKSGGGTFYGRVREITTFPISLSQTKFTISTVLNGYIIGNSTSATSDCLLLKA